MMQCWVVLVAIRAFADATLFGDHSRSYAKCQMQMPCAKYQCQSMLNANATCHTLIHVCQRICQMPRPMPIPVLQILQNPKSKIQIFKIFKIFKICPLQKNDVIGFCYWLPYTLFSLKHPFHPFSNININCTYSIIVTI